MGKIAVYPGTFDPVTSGHVDLIRRGAAVFDKLIVAIGINPNKRTLFTLEERMELIRRVMSDLNNLEVDSFRSLLVDYVRARQATVIIKGVRVISDLEYELQMANMNRKMAPDVETVLMLPSEEYSFVSSSIVREIASFGGSVKGLVPELVEMELKKKFANMRKE
ncbi:MAG: pantetheine-phosphate adenylyltransferase [Candidatus Tectomicrobia bacterium]|nr:pantetheine-phosphate adenylyltransferase [Candidatus Tectomicrobia bacterium]